VFSKLEIQPNGVDEGQCYPSFNWLAATSVVSYPSKIGIFQGIFLLGFYFTAGILFISLTMLEMMISLIKDIFFSSHLVRKLLVKFVRYFKQNLAPVRFHVRHLQQSARALQYFEQTFSAQLWYLRHFNDYIVKNLKMRRITRPNALCACSAFFCRHRAPEYCPHAFFFSRSATSRIFSDGSGSGGDGWMFQ
jgi:hypothetical protein